MNLIFYAVFILFLLWILYYVISGEFKQIIEGGMMRMLQKSPQMNNIESVGVVKSPRYYGGAGYHGGAEKSEGVKPCENNAEPCEENTRCNRCTNCILRFYKKLAEDHNANGKTIIQMHSTDWCSFCKKMKPIWKKTTENIKNSELGSNFIFLEIDQDKDDAPWVKTVPAIFKYKNNTIEKYENVYDEQVLRNWILNK